LAPHASGGDRLHLESAFPNPFNGDVRIPFRLEEDSEVEMRVYNSAGQQVLVRNLGSIPGGVREIGWDGRGGDGVSAASGRYLVVLKAGESIRATSLTLVR
jgi:flagellar hook assembly protein FlgD